MLDNLKHQISYCASCPKLCRFTCPVANAEARETSSPWGRQSLLHLIRNGHRQFDHEAGELFYHCATCLLCTRYCDHEIEVAAVMLAAREEAVLRELAHPVVDTIRYAFGKTANPFGKDLSIPLKELVPAKYQTEEAQVMYFPGCEIIHRRPEMLGDAFTVFDKLGIDYLGCFHDNVFCCGHPLLLAGLAELSKQNAVEVFTRLSAYKLIVCQCPYCLYQFKVTFSAWGLKSSTRFVHISEFLLDYRATIAAKVQRRFPGRVLYHDPCYLGRYLDIYEQPRSLLELVLEEPLHEFAWHHADAYCCGGGGALPVTAPETSQAITLRRIMEFKAEAGETLATACPTCINSFRKADPSLRVRDVVSILAACL